MSIKEEFKDEQFDTQPIIIAKEEENINIAARIGYERLEMDACYPRINKVYGYNNVKKWMEACPPARRRELLECLSKEADLRTEDPIRGAGGRFMELQPAVAPNEEAALAQREAIAALAKREPRIAYLVKEFKFNFHMDPRTEKLMKYFRTKVHMDPKTEKLLKSVSVSADEGTKLKVHMDPKTEKLLKSVSVSADEGTKLKAMSNGAASFPCFFCAGFKRDKHCSEGCIYRNVVAASGLGPGDYIILERVFGYARVARWFSRCVVKRQVDLLTCLSFEANARASDPIKGIMATVFDQQATIEARNSQIQTLKATVGQLQNTILLMSTGH